MENRCKNLYTQFDMNESPTDDAVKLCSWRFSCVRWVAVNIKFIAKHFNNNNNDQTLQICVFRFQTHTRDTLMAMATIFVWIEEKKNDFSIRVTPQWSLLFPYEYLDSLKFTRNFASLSPDICDFFRAHHQLLHALHCVSPNWHRIRILCGFWLSYGSPQRTHTHTHTYPTESVSFFHFSR